jgi:hypothetical protein
MIPNDEYGEGHRIADPRFSKGMNMAIAARDTTDGNIGAVEGMYGKQGVPPTPYGGAQSGLGPQDQQRMDRTMQGLDASVKQLVNLFGMDGAMDMLDQLMRAAAETEAQGGAPMLTQPGRAMSNMRQRMSPTQGRNALAGQ